MPTFNGTSGNDTATYGGMSDDEMRGNGGEDTLSAGDGEDRLWGGTGNDLLFGGAGADRLTGDGGDDRMYGGTGDDSFEGGSGNDTMWGGLGSDRLRGGEGIDTVSYSDATGGVTVNLANETATGADGQDEVREVENIIGSAHADTLTGDGGANTISGGDGADRIAGGDGADSLSGGAGNDSIDGGAGNDTISGGAGVDTLTGGAGTDTLSYADHAAGVHVDIESGFTSGAAAMDIISGFENVTGGSGDDRLEGTAGANTLDGGAGNDSLNARGGDDVVFGGDGNDSLFGWEGNDTLSGDGGDDSLSGGVGNDRLQGGGGNDTLAGDGGTDTLTGGAGADTFRMTAGGGADRVTDFSLADSDGDGRFDDQIDVSTLTDGSGNPVTIRNTTVVDDGQGNAMLVFPGGETLVLQGVTPAQMQAPGALHAAGVPCFAAGTLIDTATGPRPVETLRPGDLIQTRDDGLQPLRWVAMRALGAAELARAPKLRPVRIAAGALGNTAPLILSPQHAILWHHAGEETLVRAIHLARRGQPGVRVMQGARRVRYFRLLFDRHQVLRSHGLWSESYRPGPMALGALCPLQAREVAALFGGLVTSGDMQAARPILPARSIRPSALAARPA